MIGEKKKIETILSEMHEWLIFSLMVYFICFFYFWNSLFCLQPIRPLKKNKQPSLVVHNVLCSAHSTRHYFVPNVGKICHDTMYFGEIGMFLKCFQITQIKSDSHR